MGQIIIKKAMALFFVLVFLTGCSSTKLPQEESSSSIPVLDEEQETDFSMPENTIIGTVSHGPSIETQYEEDGITPLPFEYNGGIFSLPYEVSVEGVSTNIGFLVFWDGTPVAYDVGDGTEASYCHTFTQNEKKEKLSFSIRFTPTGRAGERHTLTVASIYNPDYKPDMKNSSSYGANHNIVCCVRPVYLSVDPPVSSSQSETFHTVKELTVTEEELTHDFLEKNLSVLYGMRELTMETLDKQVYFADLINGELVFDNYAISNEPVSAELCLCGTDGKSYAVTLYLDHQPVCETQRLTVHKGKITRLSVSIDPAVIKDSSTAYFVAVPLDEEDSVNVVKSRSILLYK